MFKINRNWQISFLLAALVGMSFSCNQEFPNLIKNEKENDISVAGRAPKVLYIMLTGARGKAVKKVMDADRLPDLSLMTKHAIYTFDGIADYENSYDTLTEANAWANMLTGATQTKTLADQGYADLKLDQYPTFLSRLKTAEPDLKMAAFTSSDVLKTNFLSDISNAKSFSGDDQATVEATINALQSQDSLSVILTQLSGIEKAGASTSFSGNNSTYLDAIETAGKSVSEIVDALKSRENSAAENWLIVVASGKGGGIVQTKTVNETGYDDSLRNTFIMFYNKKFQPFYVPEPRTTSGAGYFQGETVKLFGNPNSNTDGLKAEVQASESEQEIYNPSKTGQLTVEAKIRFLPHGSPPYNKDNYKYDNTPFLSKGQRYGALPGWVLWMNGNNMRIFVADGNAAMQNGFNAYDNEINFSDNNWHTLALVMWKDGSTERVRFFVDDKLVVTQQKQMGSVQTDRPLTFGYNPNLFGATPINMYIADVRIWDVKLPDDVIKAYSCIPGMLPATHPYINDLVGFWPCRDASGGVFKDMIGDNDAKLVTGGNTTVEWNSFKDVSPNVCPDPAPLYYKKVPNSVDIPFEIYNWLSVNVEPEWNLDGKAWLTGYTDVRPPLN